MARVELILRKSTSTKQYDVDLVIFDERGNPSQIVDSLSTIPPQLCKSIDNWQQSFSRLVSTRRGTIKVGKTFYGNCSDSAEEVRREFTQWLNDQTGWHRLQRYIQQAISAQEEVQINIQTIDKRLRLLPWNEVFAKHHHQAEVSISLAREFRQEATLLAKPQVRILAVLGNSGEAHGITDNSGLKLIDVNFDQQQLERTRVRGAYIETLKQPSIQELREALRDPKGWHIFFFAGHSKSHQDRSIGSVVLNGEEPPLGIDELKQELAIAIDNGLQLAIFNSCDGLGLASQLSALNLPQSIVMREPVPDDVAKDFLQQFLQAFAYNLSLFESVRRARQYLREKWDLQSKYPGASWLPIIVRNPAVSLPVWNDFVVESPLSKRQLIPLAVAILSACLGIFISLYCEFNQVRYFDEPSYLHYTKLYPHIILYPCLFLWASYYTLYKAWCQIRNRPKLWRQITACIALIIILMGIELTSDEMMLFEIKDGSEVTVSPTQEVIDKIVQMPSSILNPETFVNPSDNTVTVRKSDLEKALNNFSQLQADNIDLSQKEQFNYHTYMNLGLSYATWQGSGLFSISRIFYSIAFIAIAAPVMMSAIFWREIGRKYVFNPTKYVRYIIATQLILVSWLPFRSYHNIETKSLIFGSSLPIGGLDRIAYPVILFLLVTSIYKSWKFEASYFAGVSSLIVVITCVFFGIQYPQIVDLFFGQQSDFRTWPLWLLLSLLVLYMMHSDIFSAKPRSNR